MVVPVFFQTQAPVTHILMSADIQILLLSDTAGFPGREMKDFIQVFPADCMMTRTIVINASTQRLYRAFPVPSSPNHFVPCCLGFLLQKFIHGGLQDSPLISGEDFCVPLT